MMIGVNMQVQLTKDSGMIQSNDTSRQAFIDSHYINNPLSFRRLSSISYCSPGAQKVIINIRLLVSTLELKGQER